MAGFFITLEGTEGAGKSTQAARLAARLRAAGHLVRELREPGGTAVGEAIRDLVKHRAGAGLTPAAELLLINASRAQLVREVIRPALAAGEVVVCDRFYDSTTAYQGRGRGLDYNLVRAVIDAAVGPTRPDLTLWLALPAAAAAARVTARGSGADRFEAAGDAFFQRVEAGYAAIAAAEPDRVVKVSAEGTVDEVDERVWAVVSARLMNASGGSARTPVDRLQFQIRYKGTADEDIVSGVFLAAESRFGLADTKVTSRVENTIANCSEGPGLGFGLGACRFGDLILVDFNPREGCTEKFTAVFEFISGELGRHFGDRMVLADPKSFISVPNTLPFSEAAKEFHRKLLAGRPET